MTEVRDYFDDIIEASEKIERFTDEMGYEEFSKNVPEEIRREYSDVPWTEMAGMRDTLIHGYATIDLRIVWATVEEEIPSLTREIRSLRDELGDE